MSHKTIAWEKWEEPTSPSLIDTSAFSSPSPPQTEDFEGSEGTEDNDFEEGLGAFFEKIPKLVNTPMGVYQVDDNMSPFKHFDCWIGHTNFDITPFVKTQIELMPGVEALIILTRYRFFIGIGKLFSFRNVRVGIEQSVCREESEEEVENIPSDIALEIETAKESLASYSHWAIFVFPNGYIDHIGTNDKNDENYRKSLLLYKNAKVLSGGVLIQSD
jgi:hypothetical protein